MFCSQNVRMYAQLNNTISFRQAYDRSTEEFRVGNLDLAVEFSRKALEVAENDKSLIWRDVAAVRLNLAHMLKLQSDFREAVTYAEQSLRDLDAHFSTSKHEVAHALDVVAELYCELGEVKKGRECVERSLEIKQRLHGTDGFPLARSYNIRGALMLAENRIEEARSDFIRALGINVRHHGRERPVSLSVGITLSNLGGVLRTESERRVACVSLYREVVRSFEANLSNPESSWMMGVALTDLAESLLAVGVGSDLEEAKGLLTRAIHICLLTRGSHHPSTNRAASLLQKTAKERVEFCERSSEVEASDFVDTLLNECEQVIQKQMTRVSGDVIFLDQRGHVGHGHPHKPLI
jgi:tetratricopeptide (TPR) repeat protein